MCHDMIEVCSIQKLCVHDGPGIRTTVFLRGCYLSCPWCCNPETINPFVSHFYKKDTCLLEQDVRSSLCLDCEFLEGKRKKEACPLGAYKQISSFYSVDDLLRILLEDSSLYKESGGGVTFSGGEPFMQAEQIAPLVKRLKEHGIHIAIETSGYFPHNVLCLLEDCIDLYLVDLKLQVGFIKASWLECDYLYDFQKNLCDWQAHDRRLIYRMVYVPEILDSSGKWNSLLSSLQQMHVESIQLLPYHNLAKAKYAQLELSMKEFSIPSPERMGLFRSFLENHAIECEILQK